MSDLLNVFDFSKFSEEQLRAELPKANAAYTRWAWRISPSQWYDEPFSTIKEYLGSIRGELKSRWRKTIT